MKRRWQVASKAAILTRETVSRRLIGLLWIFSVEIEILFRYAEDNLDEEDEEEIEERLTEETDFKFTDFLYRFVFSFIVSNNGRKKFINSGLSRPS